MGVNIRAVGGYGEVGRNMTAVTVDGETVIFDMGYHMDNLVNNVDGASLSGYSREQMIKLGVVADDTDINPKSVLAIVPSHAHLDHIGAIPFLESRYDCPIYCTPYTCEVLKRQFSDNRFRKKNRIIKTPYKKLVKLSKNLTLEFVHITHSIPHSALVVLHTPYGAVCYGNDFKMDQNPVLESKTDVARLKEIGENTLVLMSECLYARKPGHTPSEGSVKQQLQDIMLKYDKKGIFITTFTSHVARVHTIVHLAQAMGRKVIFMGRSLEKYSKAAKLAGVSDVIDKVELYSFKNQMRRRLKSMTNADKAKCVIVITGHQAEEQAVLNSMVTGKLPNPFSPDDLFIFSCNTIPTEGIIKARKVLEEKMAKFQMNTFLDIHVSGHASQDDLQELLDALKPKHVIPSHGDQKMMDAYLANLGKPNGYELGKTCHFIYDGKSVDLE